MTRRWSAQPPPAEASAWLSLIDRCPWDEAAAPAAPESVTGEADDARAAAATEPPSAPTADPQPRAPVPDGFVWLIRASWSGSDPREAELFDDQVVGAWRELVDAVRDWSTQRPPPERPGR